MTTIKWQGGVPAALPGLTETQEPNRSGGVSSDARQSLSASLQTRQQGVLASALDNALRRLDERISAFNAAAWPSQALGGLNTAGQSETAAARPAHPLTYGLDLSAVTTLAPGLYSLDYAAGGGGLTMRVDSGDTWQDVLSRMARIFGASSVAMLSRLVPAKAPDLAPLPAARAKAGADARPDRGGDAAGDFGQAAPVSVSEPVGRLTDGITDVLTAYNEVQGLLQSDSGAVKSGAAEDWGTPASQRAAALSGIGLTQNGKGASLWLDGENFLTALLSRPDEVQKTLLGADGLLPALQAKTEHALANGVDSLLTKPDAARASDPLRRVLPARTETEVEKANQLLDLFDTGAQGGLDGPGPEAGGSLLRRRG